MNLKHIAVVLTAVALGLPGSAPSAFAEATARSPRSSTSGGGHQSLGEVAKKEKKRRQNHEKSGQKARVLSEQDLTRGEDEDTPEQAREPATNQTGDAATSTGPQNTAMPAEITLNSTIPLDAPMAERNRVFDRMRELYREELENIDVTIQANKQRVDAIDRELATVGAGGLPVATTAAQATTPLDGTQTPMLTGEKDKLLADNEALETRKASMRESLKEKGRRGGINPSRLNF